MWRYVNLPKILVACFFCALIVAAARGEKEFLRVAGVFPYNYCHSLGALLILFTQYFTIFFRKKPATSIYFSHISGARIRSA